MFNSHFCFKIFFISSLAAMTLGCTQEVEEKDGALGQEASQADFRKVVDDALADVSIINSSVGHSVTYENNQRIELGPVLKTEEFTHKLIQVKEDSQTIKFVLFRDEYVFDLINGGIVSDSHLELPPVIFNKVTAQSKATLQSSGLNANSKKISDLQFRSYGADCDGRDETDKAGHVYDCLKIYNLKSLRKVITPPEAVRAKPNCMGLPDCQMLVQSISYDEVKWKDGQAVDKVTLSYEIAKVVPDLIYLMDSEGQLAGYLPPVMSFCQRGHMMLGATDSIVTLCTVLKDFNLTAD